MLLNIIENSSSCLTTNSICHQKPKNELLLLRGQHIVLVFCLPLDSIYQCPLLHPVLLCGLIVGTFWDSILEFSFLECPFWVMLFTHKASSIPDVLMTRTWICLAQFSYYSLYSVDLLDISTW